MRLWAASVEMTVLIRGDCFVERVGLVEGVYGEAAEEFGVEVGGFLRHDLAGEGDVLELVEGDGLDEEGDVGFAGFDEADGFIGFAEVLDAAGGSDFFFG